MKIYIKRTKKLIWNGCLKFRMITFIFHLELQKPHKLETFSKQGVLRPDASFVLFCLGNTSQ